MNHVEFKCETDIIDKGNAGIYANFLRHIQTHCLSVKRFKVFFNGVSKLSVNTILQGLSLLSLEEVSLDWMSGHSDVSLEMLFSPQSQLISIAFDECNLSEENMSMIFNNCKNLEYFYTSYCERLPMEFRHKYPNVRIRQSFCDGEYF